MPDNDRLTRMLTGGAVTTPLFMLANRYLLGNRSNKSAALAAALGFATGAGGGYLYDSYGYKKNNAGGKGRKDDLIPELTEQILRSPEELKAYKSRLIAAGADPDAVGKFLDSRVAALNKLDEYRSNPRKLNEFYTEDALDELTPEQRSMFDSMVKRIEYVHPKNNTRAKQYAGIPNLTRERFEKLYGEVAGYGTWMNRSQLLARMAYHRNLQEAHQALRQNKDGGVWTNPVALDYIALRAMPANLRRHLPVMHRLKALQRAIISKGHSYDLDKQIFFDPEAQSKAIASVRGHDSLLPIVSTAITALGGGKLPANIAGMVIESSDDLARAAGMLQPRKEYGNSLWDDFWHSREVVKPMWDPKVAPIYDHMLPRAQQLDNQVATVSLLPRIVDLGLDTKSLLRSGVKTFSNGRVVHPKRLPNLVTDIAGFGASRALEAYGGFSPYENLAEQNAQHTRQFVDSEGRPLGLFNQLLMANLYGTQPNTGLQESRL
jgi:hypothetical protein